ncbi:ABC transporter permease [Microbacterium caowuchunii]|uniref:ABC transporter permease subunit n=1 Tax=Microbacterium caowuchunii TaxID=2614638 RepID=A0A5N0TD33_9MICO|nr:ABC transporter permease subunit [Microbacterium caowuchunii]KAA9132354.1 ABC transporter permease subunit [Microbacterium caowuchunii]
MTALMALRSPRGIGALAIVGIIALWWLAAATFLAPLGTVPTPAAVVGKLWTDGFSFYAVNVSITALEALQGYAIGVGLALAIAALVLLVPRLNGVAMQAAVISYCIPIVAIGPVIYLIVGAPAAGHPSGTAVVLAAMSVFFTTLVNALLGLRSVDARALELVSAYGGGKWQQLRRVRTVSAIPSILNGLKIAAPAAVLGAILGEYVGGVDRGLGPALVSAQQAMDVDRTWALAFVSAALAGAWYALLAALAAFVDRLGWRSDAAASAAPSAAPASAARIARSVGGGALSLALVLLAWPTLLWALSVSPFVGKTPAQVWTYLVTGDEATEHLPRLIGALAHTLADAGLGFLSGLTAAVVVAVLFVLARPVEHAFMPFAMLMRSMPLVAMAPVIILIFGRGTLTVAIMGGLIVFFPALVTIVFALRSTPEAMTDLVRVYGGGRLLETFVVRFPACIPALFASVRVAIPGAIAGALLAEWLATGEGLGYVIISAMGRSNNTEVWACVALVTGASLALYGLATLAEQAARRRWA